MTIQQRIFDQMKGKNPPESGEFIVEDSTEVVETGFPIGAKVKFVRIPCEAGTVKYGFESAIPAA